MIRPVVRYYYYALALLPFIQIFFGEFLNINFINIYGLAGNLIFLYFLLKGTKLKVPNYVIAFSLLVIYYLIWDIVNATTGRLQTTALTYLYRNHWIQSLFLLILIENTEFDEKFIDNIVKIFKVTIVLAFIVSLIHQFYNPYFLVPDSLRERALSRDIYNYRSPSLFGYLSSTEIGSSFVPIVSILIGYYLYKKERFNILWLVMSGLICFINKSRFIYLNFAVILLQYPIVNGIKIKNLIKITVSTFIIAILIIAALKFNGFDFNRFIEERLLSPSAATRFLAWELFLKFFPENPFFGSGIHVSEELRRAIAGRSSQIHVGYLSSLYEYGIVGSILLFGFWYIVQRKFWLEAKKTSFYGSAFAFLTLILTNATGVKFSIYSYGLLFAFIFNKYIMDLYADKTAEELTPGLTKKALRIIKKQP